MKRVHKQTGFTIVELLIVVVVIAILAAITIVAYNGMTNRTHDTSVQSDLRNISQQVKLHHAEKGVYPNSAQLFAMTVTVSKNSYLTSNNAMIYCAAVDGSNFAIIGKSKSGTTYYSSSNTGAVVKASFTFPTGMNADCPAAGVPSETNGAIWMHTSGASWSSWVKG